MKTTTRRVIPILAQIVQRYLPGYKIKELAADEKIKAREFSYSAQAYLLMLDQLAHVFSLNELVDLSTIFAGELRRIHGIEAVKLTSPGPRVFPGPDVKSPTAGHPAAERRQKRKTTPARLQSDAAPVKSRSSG